MMGRYELALLAALPFAVTAAAPTCYDRLLKNGDPWTDAVSAKTCVVIEGDPTEQCTREERSRNEFVSAEACCHCGGGTAPYYVELPSNTCVNDGAHALQVEGLITFLAKEDCCNSLPRKEKRECLQTGPSATVFPDYQKGQCSSAAQRPPVVYPACAVDATGVSKYLAPLFLKESLPLSGNEFCCMSVYAGLPAAINRCKTQAGKWYYVAEKGCVRDDGVADDPVAYATAQAVETPSTCRAKYFSLLPAVTCTAFTCPSGTADKSGKADIHCGTQAGDCTETLCCDATCTHNSVKSEKLCVDGFVYRAGVATVKCADGTVAGCLEVFHEQCCDVTCYAVDCGAGKERIANANARRCAAGSHLLAQCVINDCCFSDTCVAFYSQAGKCGDSVTPNPLVSDPSKAGRVTRTFGDLGVRKMVMRPGRPGFFFAAKGSDPYAAVFMVDVTSFAGGDGKVGRTAFATSVKSFAVFADGNRLLTAEDNGGVSKVRAWEVVDTVWEFTMLGSVDIASVHTIAMLPGDKHFVTGDNIQNSVTKTIKMWDASTLAQVGTFTFTGGVTEYPLKITALPKRGKYGSGDQSKTYFAVLTSNRQIVTFDTEQPTSLRKTATGHTDYIWDWDILADGTFVTASKDGTLRITDGLGNGVKTFVAYAPSKANGGTVVTPQDIRSVSAAEYGLSFVSGDVHGNVFLWDAAEATPMRQYDALASNTIGIAIAPSGWHPTSAGAQLLISAANKVTVRPLSKQGCGACAEANCCAHTCIEFDCSAALPVTGFKDKADKNAIVCGANKGDCTAAVCCDATCGARTNLCTPDPGFRLKDTPAATDCTGPLETSCDRDTCCQATCGDRGALCTAGFRLKNTPANVDCTGPLETSCNLLTCCHATCDSRDALCTAGWRLKNTPANVDCTGPLNTDCDLTCCHATCDSRDALCTADPGYALKATPEGVDCTGPLSTDCVRDTCCNVVCATRGALCTTTGYILKVNPETVVCSPAVCDEGKCCDETCVSFSGGDNTGCTTPGQVNQLTAQRCTTGVDCNEATCCAVP